MEKLHTIATLLERSDSVLRRAALDPANNIPHIFERRNRGRNAKPSLWVDGDAMRAWAKANPPKETGSDPKKVAGKRVYLRLSEPKLYGTIHDARGEGMERQLLITWDNATTPEWMPHYEARLVKDTDK